MSWTRFMPNVHKLRHPPFEDFLRRDLGREEMAVVYHVGTRYWIACVWQVRDGERGLYQLVCLNQDPEGVTPRITPDDIAHLRWKMYGSDMAEHEAEYASQQKSKLIRQKEDDEEALRRLQFGVKRKFSQKYHDCPVLGMTVTPPKGG